MTDIMVSYHLHSLVPYQICVIGTTSSIIHLIILSIIIASYPHTTLHTICSVSDVVCGASQEPTEVVKAPASWPVVFVTDSKVPFTHCMSRIVGRA